MEAQRRAAPQTAQEAGEVAQLVPSPVHDPVPVTTTKIIFNDILLGSIFVKMLPKVNNIQCILHKMLQKKNKKHVAFIKCKRCLFRFMQHF